jgi:polyferredoxin
VNAPARSAVAADDAEASLYEVRKKIYPRAVRGWFAAWRWTLVWATQLVFYGGAWLTWNGRQGLLFDIAHRKFYLFGLVFWPQDIIYLTVLLIVSALSLFLFTALFGRLWCGYACPQTVYTEIFMWIERRVEGDRNARMRLDQSPGARKFLLKGAKHALWIALALWTGFTFVGYFTPIRELSREILSLQLGPWEAFWVFFYGFATYGNAGWMREQVCKYMCPYARFQSAMFDKDTLIITYDQKRGEPRGKAGPANEKPGDCIDCGICVQVCPTGIDIRKGLQYECIGCAACIDGCDQVMDKLARPRKLIRYSTTHALEGRPTRGRRPRGEPVPARAAQGRRDPRPRGDRPRSGRGRDRERLPPADHEHHRAAAQLRDPRRGDGADPRRERAARGGGRRGEPPGAGEGARPRRVRAARAGRPPDHLHRERARRRGRSGA